MRRQAVIFYAFAICFLTCAPAYAAAVTNLDGVPHLIQVDEGGGFRPQEIQSGQTFRLIGPAKVRYNGREARIDAHEEYAIWKDGTFGVQMRKRKASGNVF